jgi:5'-3' exonuclease
VTDPGLAVRPLLERLSADPIIYRQDRQIVMVDGDTIVPVRSATLRGYASRKIGFVKTTKKGKIAGAGFAREVCEVAIESDLIPSTIREIKRVTTDPVPLLVDGRFELSTPGYHDGLLHVDGGLDVDRAEPSRARAERGYALLADLFADWPIVDQPSLASAIALAVSLVARHLITGPCPAWVASSNIRGSGKGLLLRTISMIATGRATAETVLAEGRDEQGKQVVAAFRSQQPMILFDEIKSLRQIHELDSIVTAYPSYSSRTLGKSEMVELPATPIWCVAGNNVSVEADSVRRVVAIRLESAVARPEEREDFRHANIVDHVTANRQAYYQALIDLIGYSLTIDDAYRVRAMGSFEAWSRLIRRPLVQIGGADPLDSRASLGIDVIEHDRAKVLIDLLAEHGPCKAESLHRFAAELEMVGIDPKRVAYALRRERGVIVDGLQITYTPGEFPWAATTPRRAVSPRMPEPDPESDPEPDPALVSRAAIQPSPRPWGSMVDPAIEARGGPGSIAIIDGTGTICRGYFADPGSAVGGLHLLAREIQALRWAGLERIVVCLDSRSRTRDHRREASDGYKANRDGREKPEGLLAQLGLASQSCRALGVHVDSDPGVEADDLIAYYALLGVPEGLTKITIVSIDKDLEQLAHDGPCSVATLNKGQVLGPAEIEAKRGVPVRHLGTYLSLVGDASDGVRGVDGVGPKTAIRLIAEHGSLERILAAADQIGGAVGRALVTCADQARLARELVQLRPDLCSPRTMPGPDPVSPIDKAWLDQYGLES